MRRKGSKRLAAGGLLLAVMFAGAAIMVQAQDHGHSDHAPACDVEALLEHQQEHSAALENLADALHDDPDAALEALYVTGIAYQKLALDCGFARAEEAAAAHDAEHDGGEQAAIARALAAGDAERGQELFNTIMPEAGFACATCHLTDTMERLIGPGLLGVGDPAHDPSHHAEDEAATHDAHAPAAEAAHGHGAPEATEAAPTGDVVDYLHTSIVDPNAYIVPGFPENLMPQVYGEILSEQDIDDLIAYLLTLK